MVKRNVRARLADILRAIEQIEDALGSNDFGGFSQNVIVCAAVERFIEIIAEASRHIPSEMTDRHPTIPWIEVRGIGNRLRHDYNKVDVFVVWRTATTSMPELKSVILAMLAEIDRDSSTKN